MEKNWKTEGKTSSVKNQGAYGTCSSHGLIAVLESMLLIKGMNIELSEADNYYCGQLLPSEVVAGSTSQYVTANARKRGVVIESLFPYGSHFVSGNPTCYIDPDRDSNSFRLTSYARLRTLDLVRSWLLTTGPIYTTINIYSDFYSFTGTGIYRKTSGATAISSHNICVVGFSDIEQCWIIKNSWGTGWGDAGYAKIAYGEINLLSGTTIDAYGIDDVIPYIHRNQIFQKLLFVANNAYHSDIFVICKAGYNLAKTATWLTLGTSLINGNAIVTLTYTANTNNKARTAVIELRDAADKVVSKMILKQGGIFA